MIDSICLFQNKTENLEHLDLSYKTDLEFWGSFGGENLVLPKKYGKN